MDTILNAVPVVFVASFIGIWVMAFRQKGEGPDSTDADSNDDVATTNTNGLPMNGGVDVLGNPYGITINH